MGASKIGYERLSLPEKKVYERFERAFFSYTPMIDGSDFDRNVDVMKVLQVVLGDNPHVIYFNKTQIRMFVSMLRRRQFHLTGAYSAAQSQVMGHELQQALRRATEKIYAMGPVSDFDKLMYIYEYLQDNVTYDEQELDALCKYGKSKNPQSHNAYGALVKGTAVCDGISAAFCFIAQSLGYSCMVVNGRATFRSSGFSEHSWCIIQIGAKYYHLDATWDINKKQATGEYSYEYFCVDDESINTDHNWEISMTPPCSGNEFSFYSRNQCYANNLTQLDEIFARYAKRRLNVVRAKVSDRVVIPEPEDQYLGKRLIDAASSAGRYGRVTYSWNRSTRCFFAKFSS